MKGKERVATHSIRASSSYEYSRRVFQQKVIDSTKAAMNSQSRAVTPRVSILDAPLSDEIAKRTPPTITHTPTRLL